MNTNGKQTFRNEDERISIGAIRHVGSLPNSSAIIAAALAVTKADALAVVRSVALLGSSFNVPTTVEVMGESMLEIGRDTTLTQTSLENLLRAVHIKLRSSEISQAPSFSLDASITLASFLTASSISVQIRELEPVLKHMNGVR
jgi:hypothetical protein